MLDNPSVSISQQQYCQGRLDAALKQQATRVYLERSGTVTGMLTQIVQNLPNLKHVRIPVWNNKDTGPANENAYPQSTLSGTATAVLAAIGLGSTGLKQFEVGGWPAGFRCGSDGMDIQGLELPEKSLCHLRDLHTVKLFLSTGDTNIRDLQNSDLVSGEWSQILSCLGECEALSRVRLFQLSENGFRTYYPGFEIAQTTELTCLSDDTAYGFLMVHVLRYEVELDKNIENVKDRLEALSRCCRVTSVPWDYGDCKPGWHFWHV
ncbi:MAG: hypothetical protein Q9165_005643 [Trypethelium subeluteriae]